MSTFLNDSRKNNVITWEFLIEDIRNTSKYNPYCKSEDYYIIFKSIILSLLIGDEIILLDPDYTDFELKSLTGYSNFACFDRLIDKNRFSRILDKDTLISEISRPNQVWKVTLFTSGTTGVPKKISHNFDSITRFVKVVEKNRNCRWGFAYSPTHMAGIQVFFQALLNGNSIYRLFGLIPKDVYNEIKNNEITHISATPTFYRLLLPCIEKFPSVQRITSGGEKFNQNTFNQLKDIFPNAKITNVYASTEVGALLASQNEIFSIHPKFEGLVCVRKNELLIHNSLMGFSDIQFDEWYNTGDLVEVVSENPLKFSFLNRKSEMINVGGYKVNPLEVEEALLTLREIKNARVFSKANSVLGNVICCEVVVNDNDVTESYIRKFLQSKIQEFKIPRVFRFVNELSTTRTGKLQRNNL